MNDTKSYNIHQADEIIKEVENTIDMQQFLLLVESAIVAKENSYSPYSKFRVGCSLLTDQNEIIKGTNVENISYGITCCAERSAIFNGVSNGIKGFKIAVLTSDMDYILTPCGACRQVLAEFEIKFLIAFTKGKVFNVFRMDYLLPNTPYIAHLRETK